MWCLVPAQKSGLLAKKFVVCTLEGLIQRGLICDMDSCQLFVNCNSTKKVFAGLRVSSGRFVVGRIAEVFYV